MLMILEPILYIVPFNSIILLRSIHCLWKGINTKGMFGAEGSDRKEKNGKTRKKNSHYDK